jgi:RNA polymerase sigma-70 factor (ECF subfamily)
MVQPLSFQHLMSDLKAGDDRACREIWQRFVDKLRQLAYRRLAAEIRRGADADDVLQAVFLSFYRRHRKGEFAFDDWTEVWTLLAQITVRKCANQAKYATRKRRDARRHVEVRTDGPHGGLPEPLDRDPTPEEAAAVADLVETLTRSLDETDRPVLPLLLQGYTQEEITEHIHSSPSTVKRVIRRIRSKLARLVQAS